MQFLKDTTWSEIFDRWQAREAGNPAWVEVATKIKGWPDWQSWRQFTADQLVAPQRQWKLYQLTNPLCEVPAMLLGPFPSWQHDLEQKNTLSFEAVLALPGQQDKWSANDGVKNILNGLPFDTELIGLRRGDNHRIVCVEGHHRAMAIALAKRQGQSIDFSQTVVTLALADLPAEEVHILDDILQRGTGKNGR